MKRSGFSLNILALAAGILMIIAMFFPWWSFELEYTDQTDLYPYMIDGPGSELVGYRRSPQMALLTGVLIAAIALCLAGSVLKGKAGRIMIAVSGALVLLAVWRLLVRVEGVAERFGLSIQGHTRGSLGGFAQVEVWTWLQPGLYLIVIGGILAIIASIFHSKLRLER